MKQIEKFILNGVKEYIEENVTSENIFYKYGLTMYDNDFDIDVFNDKVKIINFLKDKKKLTSKKYNLDW